MNDSGGGAEIYEINESGNLIRAKKLQNLINRDWEDLTSDPGGALYIGDIGNNGNSRDSLRIYILNPDLDLTGTINYSYEPSEGNRSGRENSEAFFFYDDSLYFFSKSNEIKGGSVRLYRLPAKPGNYQAEFIDEITINGQVTSADVSPDKQEFVLLTYGKLLFFDIKEGKIDFQLPSGCLKMANKQAEAILYLDSKQLLVTNEQRDIFRLSEKNKK